MYASKKVNRYAWAIIVMLSAWAFAGAQRPLAVDSVRLARNGQTVQLAIDVSIGAGKPAANAMFVITPRLVGERDSVDFPQIVALGRNAYYHDVRQGTSPAGEDADAFKIRYKYGPRAEHYVRAIGHQPWMENSTLKLVFSEGTPCDATIWQTATYQAFTLPPPDTTYVEHRNKEQDELTGSVSGQARIQFIVNRTEFVPTLSRNKEELEKMLQSIVDVNQNPDVRITRYRIKGYASPEGPYDNNVRLAKGRTERLRQFMVTEWGVPQSQIDIEYEPEDWQGFREYMVKHYEEFPDAHDIIAIIDDDDPNPDHKLAVIAARHPASYKRILAECFPPLRRTDYEINYEWLRIVEREGQTTRDTIVTPRLPKADDPLEPDIFTPYRPTRPWLAVKTNLLFDLALAPNFELEMQLGRDSRWSIMFEDWFPWFLYKRNHRGDTNPYRRPDQKAYASSYEIWTLGMELRYWLSPRCRYSRPWLTGTFVGIYGAGGKYDWERNSRGYQGEFTSLGVTIGHSWPLSRAWNMELSASAGFFGGPQRYYHGRFDDARLIWQSTGHKRYLGPTKLKLSVAWLIPSLRRHKEKGGAHD